MGLLSAADVPFGVLKLDEIANRRDLALRQDHLAPIRLHGCGCGVDIGHADRAFVAVHFLAFDKFMPLLQGARYARVILRARGDEEEVGRTPGLELPTKYLLVKAASPCQVV